MSDPGFRRVGANAMGRDIIQGTIHDPATLRLMPDGSDRYIADPFFGNIIPNSLFSTVSQNVMKVGVPRYLPTYKDPMTGLVPLQQNANWPALRDSGIAQISDFAQHQYDVKFDRIFSDKHRMSGGYDFNRRPVLEPRSGGLWDYNDPQGGPWAQYFYQNMNTHRARLSEDWTVTPRVFNRIHVFKNLNTTPPGDTNTGLTSPNFGFITGSPFGNRTMQVGARLDS
jgi:hypothetical protein